MIRYKFIDTFNIFKEKPSEYGQYSYSGPKINTENAEWFLFQIGRDVQLSKNIIDIGLRDTFVRKNYSYDERDIHSIIMKAYLHFISDWEKDIKIEQALLIKDSYDKKKLLEDDIKAKKKIKIEIEIIDLDKKLKAVNSKIEQFVKKIIDTRIIIENNIVYVSIDHLELFKKIKQIVSESKFTFNEVSLEKAKSWWVRTTKES